MSDDDTHSRAPRDYQRARAVFLQAAHPFSAQIAVAAENIVRALSASDADFLQLFDECADRIAQTGGAPDYFSVISFCVVVAYFRAGQYARSLPQIPTRPM